MAASEHPLAEEGYALMGAAFEVHNVLGGVLAEEIYQQSLELELGLRGIPYRRKQQLCVYYKGALLDVKYVPDFVVYDRIVIELKSLSSLCGEREAQLMNYMRVTRSPIGYLINFGLIGKLEYKRIVCSEYSS
jgi:GxxExxY protein